jgi:hypothetical protein
MIVLRKAFKKLGAGTVLGGGVACARFSGATALLMLLFMVDAVGFSYLPDATTGAAWALLATHVTTLGHLVGITATATKTTGKDPVAANRTALAGPRRFRSSPWMTSSSYYC